MEVRMPWKENGAVGSRMEAVIRQKGGDRVSVLSREYGVSRQTIYKWIKRYGEEGACGLFDRSRRPRRSPNRISGKTERRIIELRLEYGWGGRNLRDLLAKEGIRVSAATVDRVISRNGLIRENDKQRPATRRFEREKPNQLWQMDFKGEYRLPGGTCWPLSIVDDHSRYSIGLFGLSSTNSKQVSTRLVSCFEEYGLPDAMLMDHGAPWYATSHPSGLSRITVMLRKQGIRPIFSGVGHPQTQGKVERFHRTLSRHLKWKGVPQEFDEMCDALAGFRRIYNEVKPHTSLDRRTPAQCYRPSSRRYDPSPPAWEYPPGAQVKKLTPQGTLHWRGRLYFVSQALPDEHVWCRQVDHRLLITYQDLMVREIDLKNHGTTAVVPKD
jgi:transposase InsO family protein